MQPLTEDKTMTNPVYTDHDTATLFANARTKKTGRYWTAVPYEAGGWTLSDRYHPA